ncbi:MAG: tRNA pseudouridine(38-40) synthase TruA [Planctomycetes bacterium]|nr:tRNA pseudouridine(38-40) synthase TruA [Planctomycetota bacterium]
MRNIKITIEYDGTNYCGWERQKNGMSIQEMLEKAVEGVTGEKTVVHGSGRTDAGVHALGQVATFSTSSAIPTEKLLLAVNTHLPEDIVVKRIEEVSEKLHARYNAKSKVYRYTVLTGPVGSALDRNRIYHVKYRLDEKRMIDAAECLIGEHDFRSFTTEARAKKNTVRTLLDLKIEREGERIIFTFEGSGFLYNMVRAIVGTLIDIGRGHLRVEEMKAILEARDRSEAGPTAPAKGLCLVEVKY